MVVRSAQDAREAGSHDRVIDGEPVGGVGGGDDGPQVRQAGGLGVQQERLGALGADAGQALDAVRRVTHEGLEHPEPVGLGLGDAVDALMGAARIEVRAGHRLEVLVERDDYAVRELLRRVQDAHGVVGFEARQFKRAVGA